MTDTIRAALEAAGRGMCMSISDNEACRAPCLLCREGATAAVAAFLRALPDEAVLRLMTMEQDVHRGWRDILAAAVEAAAKEAGDG
jgi:hypothetical protein